MFEEEYNAATIVAEVLREEYKEFNDISFYLWRIDERFISEFLQKINMTHNLNLKNNLIYDEKKAKTVFGFLLMKLKGWLE